MVGGEEHRGPQMRELLRACGGDKVESTSTTAWTDIICGDFNTRPTAPEMKILRDAQFVSCVPDGQNLETLYMFKRQLDHILMRTAHGATWKDCDVYCHNPPSSDHKAVVATITW
jgi:endonuclease/exonuclease/phosphatase family metal-dependent hydrolase